MFNKDMGIDLGTANTLVYVRGKGIVINEPSVVAINKLTNEICAIGSEAYAMLGRTPITLTTIRPIRNGVISDFAMTEAMLGFFI
ncbi:MAG TPA: rod shape-determining protein, partial [Lachnospiraceae bacterium]|nr:rod shape-determining protein [Lachnospiraceae bacterium]